MYYVGSTQGLFSLLPYQAPETVSIADVRSQSLSSTVRANSKDARMPGPQGYHQR